MCARFLGDDLSRDLRILRSISVHSWRSGRQDVGVMPKERDEGDAAEQQDRGGPRHAMTPAWSRQQQPGGVDGASVVAGRSDGTRWPCEAP